jgi:hypothetical protein
MFGREVLLPRGKGFPLLRERRVRRMKVALQVRRAGLRLLQGTPQLFDLAIAFRERALISFVALFYVRQRILRDLVLLRGSLHIRGEAFDVAHELRDPVVARGDLPLPFRKGFARRVQEPCVFSKRALELLGLGRRTLQLECQFIARMLHHRYRGVAPFDRCRKGVVFREFRGEIAAEAYRGALALGDHPFELFDRLCPSDCQIHCRLELDLQLCTLSLDLADPRCRRRKLFLDLVARAPRCVLLLRARDGQLTELSGVMFRKLEDLTFQAPDALQRESPVLRQSRVVPLEPDDPLFQGGTFELQRLNTGFQLGVACA